MRKIFGGIFLVVSMLVTLASVSLPAHAELDKEILNDENRNICEDDKISDELKATAGCETTKTLPAVSITLVQAILGLLSIVAVGVMVFGAVTYSTSTGDPGRSHKGQMTLLYGFVGLIVCLMAFAIVAFVIDGVFK